MKRMLKRFPNSSTPLKFQVKIPRVSEWHLLTLIFLIFHTRNIFYSSSKIPQNVQYFLSHEQIVAYRVAHFFMTILRRLHIQVPTHRSHSRRVGMRALFNRSINPSFNWWSWWRQLSCLFSEAILALVNDHTRKLWCLDSSQMLQIVQVSLMSLMCQFFYFGSFGSTEITGRVYGLLPSTTTHSFF